MIGSFGSAWRADLSGCLDRDAGPFGPLAWVGQHSVGRKSSATGWIVERKDDLSGVWRRRVGWKGPEVGAGVQDSVSCQAG